MVSSSRQVPVTTVTGLVSSFLLVTGKLGGLVQVPVIARLTDSLFVRKVLPFGTTPSNVRSFKSFPDPTATANYLTCIVALASTTWLAFASRDLLGLPLLLFYCTVSQKKTRSHRTFLFSHTFRSEPKVSPEHSGIIWRGGSHGTSWKQKKHVWHVGI